jgi:alpha-L-rhamnosidase
MWAYQQASQMEAKFGIPVMSQYYRDMANVLKATIQQKYWVAGRQLYSDVEDQQLFSQHTNSLAILTGMVTGGEASPLGKKLMTDTTLTQCTIYFKYYLHQALIKSGYGDDYLKWLDIWRSNIKMGLTTWAETSDLEHNRSDCHAWGASPNIEFYRTVLGIDSYAPGFSKVKIEPHLGDLKITGGEIPHPNGKIVVKYELKKGKWEIEIALPPNTSGIFTWKGQNHRINSGKNKIIV